ncbi:hypothetical protein [uncultured Alistipes sp.]|uniref:hypothetical protein n=1 Tax=uncultured Alistipes sp. TaxID=538949 RepID=UPI002608F1FE|nr:hypothetical protein [uncultured Alistipes sp.]
MDLLSASIRTVFYDTAVSSVVQDLRERRASHLEREFAKQISWRETAFTQTEAKNLADFVRSEVTAETSCDRPVKRHHCFRLLPRFTSLCLKCVDAHPVVRFEKLGPWRELSLLTGEDLLTTSFLAHPDRNDGMRPADYAWPNIIRHDHEALNDVLSAGLTDIHAHLKASADTFELTWLDLMNRVVNRGEDFGRLSDIADARIHTALGTRYYPIDVLVQVAAYLRAHLFRSLQRNEPEDKLFEAIRLFDNTVRRKSGLAGLQGLIDTLGRHAVRTVAGVRLDYCMTQPQGDSIYAIHSGERAWMYDFFYRYYRNDRTALAIADFAYLYFVIKMRVRSEFVQTNPLVGFSNFKTYEERKSAYCNAFAEFYPYYAAQSAIRPGSDDRLEARVVPGGIPDQDLACSLFNAAVRHDNIRPGTLSFVVHLIKSERSRHRGSGASRTGYKACYKPQIEQVLDEWRRRRNARFPNRPLYRIAGIDAAGSELNCPPAVFGHVYRYARKCGLTDLTYHVGEDFYDLADGLHSIEEALRFLGLQQGNRLGHAIALGTDAWAYYAKRNRQIVMTRQRMLDTLVWLGYRSRDLRDTPPDFVRQLENQARLLYDRIGYTVTFDPGSLYRSLWLRSDELHEPRGWSAWSLTSKCHDPECEVARTDRNAVRINYDYQLSAEVIARGEVSEVYTYPEGIEEVVSALQQQLQRKIANAGIAIECNPSSNLKIGPFDSYMQHPVFVFRRNDLKASINTDDKGIFSTSLYNEYSLIAAAYGQSGADEKEVLEFIRQLRDEAALLRFDDSPSGKSRRQTGYRRDLPSDRTSN